MHVRQRLGASERHACHVLGQPRSTQRRVKKVRVDESALRTDVIRLASRFGRYGYRQITNLLRIEGWEVNHKRESIPKLVETRVTSGRSGCGMSLAIGMDDPEFLLNRGTERREVAIAE